MSVESKYTSPKALDHNQRNVDAPNSDVQKALGTVITKGVHLPNGSEYVIEDMKFKKTDGEWHFIGYVLINPLS